MDARIVEIAASDGPAYEDDDGGILTNLVLEQMELNPYPRLEDMLQGLRAGTRKQTPQRKSGS